MVSRWSKLFYRITITKTKRKPCRDYEGSVCHPLYSVRACTSAGDGVHHKIFQLFGLFRFCGASASFRFWHADRFVHVVAHLSSQFFSEVERRFHVVVGVGCWYDDGHLS